MEDDYSQQSLPVFRHDFVKDRYSCVLIVVHRFWLAQDPPPKKQNSSGYHTTVSLCLGSWNEHSLACRIM